MVSKILRFLNRDIVSMNQAALVLAVFSLLSQLCGLLRDHLLARLVGPSLALDTYYAAFRIPDFIYNSFGIVFSVTVLIPFIARFMEGDVHSSEHQKKLPLFLNSVATVYVGGMVLVLGCVYILMPFLINGTAPGFSGDARIQLIAFSRLLLLSPFLFGLSSLLSSFAQVQKKFFSFAIAPLFYNIGILIGIIALRPVLGMKGVVIGVVFGAFLYFLVQVPTLIALQKIPRLTLSIDWKLIREIISASLPRTLGSSLSNITFLLMSALASLLAVGSISVFQLSYNIENTPLLIIGVSYAVAAFPTLSRLFAEKQYTAFIDALYRTTRTICFLAIPASFFMIVLRAHVVRVLLGAGVFSWNDTRLVAAMVALFSVSVVAQAMILLLVRAFFATGNTKRPLIINLFSLGITAGATALLLSTYTHSALFRDFMGDLLRVDGVTSTSVLMLALAFSIGQCCNAVLLWWDFHRSFQYVRTSFPELLRPLLHMIGAGIIGAAAVYVTLLFVGGSVDQHRFWGILAQACVAGVVGMAVYAGVLLLLKNQDIMVFFATVRSKFWKQAPLVQEQQDL